MNDKERFDACMKIAEYRASRKLICLRKNKTRTNDAEAYLLYRVVELLRKVRKHHGLVSTPGRQNISRAATNQHRHPQRNYPYLARRAGEGKAARPAQEKTTAGRKARRRRCLRERQYRRNSRQQNKTLSGICRGIFVPLGGFIGPCVPYSFLSRNGQTSLEVNKINVLCECY